MRRRFTRSVRNLGGADGNARLTAATGVLLIALLAVEGVTILFLRPLISVHVFVGLMLIPPVALKVASTGWRFIRYYTRNRDYVAHGPPHPVMRFVIAPLVVVSTLGVFGTGVAMLAVHPRNHTLVSLHKASFIVWLVSTGIHVLFHLPRLARLTRAELLPASRLPARPLRIAVVGVALAAGAIFAASTFHLASPWLDWVRLH
jgi:hypothetical protein